MPEIHGGFQDVVKLVYKGDSLSIRAALSKDVSVPSFKIATAGSISPCSYKEHN
ncbi:MAG: hypothetical protein ACJAZB_000835 [Psychrosphaera sp.]|jgi:hypothetical protein